MSDETWLRTGIGASDADSITLMGRDLANDLMGKVTLTELATGRSNHEIGRQPHVSEATVKTHVAAILTKLGLRDRTQAIVLAYETGFVRPGR